MDEVDNIIIDSLKQIGCDIPEEVKSLADFNTDRIVEFCVRCLRKIKEDVGLPLRLPESMSVRFRIGTALAESCKDVGYKGEIGYQTFLYSNVAEVRRLFMFLVEQLPREGGGVEDTSGSGALLGRSVANELLRQLQLVWTPPFCKSSGPIRAGDHWHWERSKGSDHFHNSSLFAPTGLADVRQKISKSRWQYYREHLDFITGQPSVRHDVPASLLERNATELTAAQEWETEWNQSGLPTRLSEQEYRQRKRDRLMKRLTDNIRVASQQPSMSSGVRGDLSTFLDSFAGRASHSDDRQGTRFVHAKDLLFTKAGEAIQQVPTTETEEEIRKRRAEQVAALCTQLEETTQRLEKMELDMKKFSTNMGRVKEMTAGIKSSNADLEDEYRMKKHTLDLLPNADENLRKLKAVVDSSAKRLVALASQWEERRVPLINHYRQQKRLSASKETESERLLAEIKALRATMKEVIEDAREKEDLHKQLVAEFERMSKAFGRSAYTRRILEILDNIRKQKNEIGKVLVDTRSLQKEINSLGGQLNRTFSVTDELIFKDCKRDETCRAVYKLFASLHDNFSKLIATVEHTGVFLRESRDLEDQIEAENKKKTASNLERISADFVEMKKENQTMMARLKSN